MSTATPVTLIGLALHTTAVVIADGFVSDGDRGCVFGDVDVERAALLADCRGRLSV
jgi:hypothetical protein